MFHQIRRALVNFLYIFMDVFQNMVLKHANLGFFINQLFTSSGVLTVDLTSTGRGTAMNDKT